MIGAKQKNRNAASPLFQGIFPIETQEIAGELIAGVTLAALAIPEVMGYTKISGTPVITGLYTLLVPMILFAVFGSSRHLVVAADSATAAILAAALVGMAPMGSSEYMALAGVLALLSAGLLMLARLIGLGFMADFLSRTVLIGFLTGVGIHIALGQVPGMLGIPGGGSDTIQSMMNILRQVTETNLYDLAIAIVVMIVIMGSKKISKRIPGALIAIVAAIVISRIVDFNTYGVSVLGVVPKGLPSIGLPDVHWSFDLVQKLLPVTFSMFIVILAQSAATSRAYAARYSESFNENCDLLGLAMANIGAGLSGTFVVNGSPTKTQMVDSAGGRTQFSQIITALIVLIVLLFFTALLANIPNSVLSSVVFLIGMQLVDIQGLSKVWLERRSEFWVALATAIVVVLIGVEQGIVIAMVLSLMEHVRHSYRSQNVVLAMDKKTGTWQLLPVTSPQQVEPGLLVYRFAHTIYYANAEQLFDQVLALVDDAGPSLSWFCIDASAVADVDFSAGETLCEVIGILKTRGVRLVWMNMIVTVRSQLGKYGIIDLCGQDAFYDSISDVLKAFKDRSYLSRE